MSAIKVFNCKVGKCYDRVSDGMYLGSYKGIGNGYLRTEGFGSGTYSPIYLFENATLPDNYPVDLVKEVECRPTKENLERKTIKKRTLKSKRRNNSRNTRKHK